MELPRFTAHPADSYIIRGKSADMACEVEGADKGGIVPLMRIDLAIFSLDTFSYILQFFAVLTPL